MGYTMAKILQDKGKTNGDKVFLYFREERISYADLNLTVTARMK